MPANTPDFASHLELDPETEAHLRAFAESRGLPPQQVLREAVDQYLALPKRRPVGGIITPV